MSAGEPPGPDEFLEQLPISPLEAQMIADAMTPFQDATAVGSSIGDVLENAPGTGPKFSGSMLKLMATQVNAASQSAETAARALTFYAEAQSEGLETAFPPPAEAAKMARDDIQPALDLIKSNGGPFSE